MHIFVNNYMPGEFHEAVYQFPHAVVMVEDWMHLSTSSASKTASKYASQECFSYHLLHVVNIKLD